MKPGHTFVYCLSVLLAWQIQVGAASLDDEQTWGHQGPAMDLSLQWSLGFDQAGHEPQRTFFTDPRLVNAKAEERPWYYSGYPWKESPAGETDWQGLKRDTVYFLGYQVAVIGVLYLMPTSVTNWDKDSDEEDDDENRAEKWRENVTNPEWDQDDWWLNYITHPYWGATYYIRGRERGLDRGQSFLFSALLSTLFEYSLEAFAEPVSIQDLIVTPVIGSLVGEYWFTPLRQRIRAKPGDPSWSDKTLLFLTDPLGVMSAWTDRTLGVNTEISVQPIGLSRSRYWTLDTESGLSPHSALASHSRRPLGIQIKISW